jgi:hypothetical protein
MAEQVDLPQAHGVEEVADGRGMLGNTCPERRWIGIPESGQIRGKNRAPGSRNSEKSLETPTRVGAIVQAEQRRALLEATAGGDRVVHVQLAIAALEIAAADARA